MIRFSDFKKKQPPETIPFSQPLGKRPEKEERPPRIRVIKVGEEVPAPEKPTMSTDRGTIEPVQVKTVVIKPFGSAGKKEPGVEEKLPDQEVNLASLIKTQDEVKPKKAGVFYDRMSTIIKKNFQEINPLSSLKESGFEEVFDILNEMISFIISDDRSLLDLTNRYSSEDYEVYHSINVGILALYVGQGLGYNESRLKELGLVGTLYGLAEKSMHVPQEIMGTAGLKFPNITITDMKTKGEIIYLILKTANQPPSQIEEQDEAKVKIETIIDYTKVLNVIDNYETLIHPLSYRRMMPLPLAIKEIIETTPVFDRAIVKAMIKKIGLYPVGSWIELNTGEIGQVVGINERFPLRPSIQIVFDPAGRKLMDTKIIALTQQQNLYIKTTVSEEELKRII